MRTPPSISAAVRLALLVAPLVAGCATVPQATSAAASVDWVRKDARIDVLAVRVTEFENRHAAHIARAADRIAAESPSPDVRRAALLWKADATALGQAALLRSDPLAALFDTWSLLAQMRQNLVDGAGAGLFGESQPLAITALDELLVEVRTIALTVVAPDRLPELEAIVDEALARYPIDGPLYTRQSPILDHADLAVSTRSLGDVAANLDLRLGGLQRQITLYAADLPRQARWQAELLLEEPLRVLAEAIQQLTPMLLTLPGLVQEHRDAVLEAVKILIQEQQDAVLESIDEQRQDTIEALRVERAALTTFIEAELRVLLADVERQRLDTLEAVRGERQIVLAAVDAEREETVDALRELVDASIPAARRLIDHAFVRLLELLALLGILGLLALALLRRQGRPPRA